MSQLRIHRADRRVSPWFVSIGANRENGICPSCGLVSFFSKTDHSLVPHPTLWTPPYRLAIVLADRSTWRVVSRFDLYESLRKRISPHAGTRMYVGIFASNCRIMCVCVLVVDGRCSTTRWAVLNHDLVQIIGGWDGEPRYRNKVCLPGNTGNNAIRDK